MTHLHSDPRSFTEEMIEGFVAAHPGWVKQAPGGVVTASPSTTPKVSVVVGGGSGHYPAFAGLVGPGLADGAVMGNIFASPSAGQVVQIASRVDQGCGVLLTFGNYAGDVLQFAEGSRRLAEQGVEARIVTVTDDIFSAPPDQVEKRRGIAGDLAVFKVAGASALAGNDLDEVERVAREAVDRTRTMGVAFSGCTLPGASAPLFTVPEGRMSIGLGIHGEPGIGEVPVPSPAELAKLLVDRLLSERPSGATRVVPILNGLGSVKYEELFVLFAAVNRSLLAHGLTIVDPQVGEFCTSFDMAGLSLTLFWPTPELEELWLAPASTPSFRRGELAAPHPEPESLGVPETPSAAVSQIPPACEDSRKAASAAAELLGRIADSMNAHADELGRIDALAGDGDHGIGMQRGSRAAAQAATSAAALGAGVATTLTLAAESWSDAAGGTSGAIWAVILRTVAAALSDTDSPTEAQLVAGLSTTGAAVTSFGGAVVGDKTLADALIPFADTVGSAYGEGLDLPSAVSVAARAADDGAKTTAGLWPRLGRSRTHGERAVGIPDPGAVSLSLIAGVAAEYLNSSIPTNA